MLTVFSVIKWILRGFSIIFRFRFGEVNTAKHVELLSLERLMLFILKSNRNW